MITPDPETDAQKFARLLEGWKTVTSLKELADKYLKEKPKYSPSDQEDDGYAD